jgi:hypothetical protein
MSTQRRKSKMLNRKSRGKSQSTSSIFSRVLDVGKALSDGSVVSLQDAQEFKGRSNQVPQRIPRSFERQIHWITTNYEGFATVTPAGTALSLNFQVNSMPNITALSAVFDQYCIREVTVKFQPQDFGLTNTNFGQSVTVIDHDDSNALSSITAGLQYSTCLANNGDKAVTRVVAPRFAVGSYSGAFTGFGNMTGWIDAASSQVQHYGIKYYGVGSSANFSLVYYVRMITAWRDNH